MAQPSAKQLKADLARLEQVKRLQAEIKELEKQKALRRRHWAIRYYDVRPDQSTKGPHRKQGGFHADPSQVRIVSGANRSGKSTAGINEDVAFALGYRPWLEKTDPNYKIDIRVPNKGLILGESFQEQVRKVLIPKLLGNPEANVPGKVPTYELASVKRNPQGVITTINFKNGSQIFLQSYDQDLDLFESADYDWAHFDEPPPRAIWVAVQRGLMDRRGKAWITMTPLKEPWLYDELYSRAGVGIHYFDISDNLEFGLTEQAVTEFAANLTDDEKEARLHGRYFHLTGLVYKKFMRDLHVRKREKVLKAYNGKVPKHWGMWMHIDTHPRTPHHAVWMAIDQHQRKYVCGALKNSDAINRVEPFCEAMKVYEQTVLGRHDDNIVRLIDPLAKTQNPTRDDGKSMADLFAENGFACEGGSKNRDAGILLFQNELNHDLEAGHFPNIFVFEDLEGVIFELTHYQWDDHTAKGAEKHDLKQTPVKKNDHFIEGIHRILLDEPFCDTDVEDDVPREREPASVNAWTGY